MFLYPNCLIKNRKNIEFLILVVFLVQQHLGRENLNCKSLDQRYISITSELSAHFG